MKHVLTLAAIILTSALMAAQTIAVIDMEAILAKHPNTPNDKKQLEMTMEDYSKERDELKASIQDKEAELQKKAQEAQNPMLSPAKADELKKACMAMQRDLESAYRSAEAQMQQRGRDLSDLEQRLIKRTTGEVQVKIKAFAEKNGYDVVLYKNLVPYVASKYDVTDQIIVLCGGTPDKKAKDAETLKAPTTLKDSKPVAKTTAPKKAAATNSVSKK